MPEIRLWLPSEITVALDRQARGLLLSRRDYARAVLAAVARETDQDPNRAEEVHSVVTPRD